MRQEHNLYTVFRVKDPACDLPPQNWFYWFSTVLQQIPKRFAVPVATVWLPFIRSSVSAFRIILRTKAKFRSTVKDPVVETGNVFCTLITEILPSQSTRKHAENMERTAKAREGTFPVMTQSQCCWSSGVCVCCVLSSLIFSVCFNKCVTVTETYFIIFTILCR